MKYDAGIGLHMCAEKRAIIPQIPHKDLICCRTLDSISNYVAIGR